MRLRLLVVFAAVVLVAEPAWPSCASLPEHASLAVADVVFEGVAPPAVRMSSRALGHPIRGILGDPVHFLVTRYVKGSGPQEVLVNGGTRLIGDGYSTTSVSLAIQAGDKWLIYGKRTHGEAISTSECQGSRRLGEVPMVVRKANDLPLTLAIVLTLGVVIGTGSLVARRIVRVGDKA